jgi:hypothetical protein
MLVAVAAAMLALAVSVPAAAAPAPTSWTVTPASKILTYGQCVMLNGTLMSEGVAVGGLWVELGQATTPAGPFEVAYRITSPAGPYATGTYSIPVMPLQTTYYRFSWPGDATYAQRNSSVVPVQVRPWIGKPSCPSGVKKWKSFTVKGSLKPGQGVVPPVKIRVFKRNSSGAYVSYKTATATVSGTRYTRGIKLGAGKYRFQATTGATTEFAAGISSYSRILTVRR